MPAKIPAHIREQQINDLPNISFVRWADVYKNAHSKAVLRCEIDGFEWEAQVCNLLNQGTGCPQCSGTRRWTEPERVAQINSLPNIRFMRWAAGFRGNKSRVICRCDVDGFEWATPMEHLLGGTGCPQCSGQRRWTADERVEQINRQNNTRFIRWVDGYRSAKSRAVCRCFDGHEWVANVSDLIHGGTGCPRCSKTGFNSSLPATLYILRSECGTMMKIGISNYYAQRHRRLERSTPFRWGCIELIHGDGALVASAEKGLLELTERVEFVEKFDGHTEWRKWDDRLPLWLEHYRRNIEAP